MAINADEILSVLRFKVIEEGGEKLSELNKGFLGIAAAAATATEVLSKSIEDANQLEEAMKPLETQVGATKKQMEEYTQAAINISNQTGIAAKTVGSAMVELGKTGITGAAGITAATIAAKQAKISHEDLATVVRGESGIFKAWGVSAKDMKSAGDLMAVAVAHGATSYGDFGNALVKVAQPAKAAGVSFGELTAATSTLTQEHIKARAATTGLTGIFQLLSETTKTQQKNADSLGVSWNSIRASGGGLLGHMQAIDAAARKNATSQADYNSHLKVLLGSTAAMNTFLALSQNGFAGLKTHLDAAAHSTGAVSDGFKASMASFGEQMKVFDTNIQNIGIQIGLKLLPPITEFLTFITSNLPTIEGIFSTVFTAIGNIVTPILGAIKQAISDVWTALNQPAVLSALKIAWHDISGAFHDVGTAIGTVLSSIRDLLPTMDTGTSKMGGMRDAAKEAATHIADMAAAFRSGMDALTPFIGHLTDLAHGLGDLAGAVGTALSKSKDFQDALKQLKDAFTPIGDAIKSLMGQFSDMSGTTGKSSVDWKQLAGVITDIVIVAVKLLAVEIKFMADAFKLAMQLTMDAVQTAVTFLTDAFKVVGDIATILSDLFHGKWGKIAADTSKLASDVFTLFQDLANNVLHLVMHFVGNILTQFGDLISGILGAAGVPKLINGIVTWFTNLPKMLVTPLANFVKGVMDSFTTLATKIATWFGDELKKITTFVQQWMSAMSLGITDKMGDIKTALVDNVVKPVIQAALDYVNAHNPFSGLISMAQNAMSFFQGSSSGGTGSAATSGPFSQGSRYGNFGSPTHSDYNAGSAGMLNSFGPTSGTVLDTDFATGTGGQRVVLPTGASYTLVDKGTRPSIGGYEVWRNNENGGKLMFLHVQASSLGEAGSVGGTVQGGTVVAQSGAPTGTAYGNDPSFWHLCVVTDGGERAWLSTPQMAAAAAAGTHYSTSAPPVYTGGSAARAAVHQQAHTGSSTSSAVTGGVPGLGNLGVGGNTANSLSGNALGPSTVNFNAPATVHHHAPTTHHHTGTSTHNVSGNAVLNISGALSTVQSMGQAAYTTATGLAVVPKLTPGQIAYDKSLSANAAKFLAAQGGYSESSRFMPNSQLGNYTEIPLANGMNIAGSPGMAGLAGSGSAALGFGASKALYSSLGGTIPDLMAQVSQLPTSVAASFEPQVKNLATSWQSLQDTYNKSVSSANATHEANITKIQAAGGKNMAANLAAENKSYEANIAKYRATFDAGTAKLNSAADKLGNAISKALSAPALWDSIGAELSKGLTDGSKKLATMILDGTGNTMLYKPGTKGTGPDGTGGTDRTAIGTERDQVIADMVDAYKKTKERADAMNQALLEAAKAEGDWTTALQLTQKKITDDTSNATAGLTMALHDGTGGVQGFLATIVAGDAAMKAWTIATQLAAAAVAVAENSFSKIGTVLTGFATTIRDQLMDQLVAGGGVNQQYLQGLQQVADAQQVEAEATAGVNLLLATNQGNLAAMATEINTLTNIDLAKWQRDLHDSGNVINDHTAALKKDADIAKQLADTQAREDIVVGMITQDAGKLNTGLNALFTQSTNSMDLFTAMLGRVDESGNKYNDSLTKITDKSIALADNLGSLSAIVSGLGTVVSKVTDAALTDFARTGTISGSDANAVSSANAAQTNATWTQVAGQITLAKQTHDLTGYYAALGNEITLEENKLVTLGTTVGVNSDEYKKQATILANMKAEYTDLGLVINSYKTGVALTGQAAIDGQWALDQFNGQADWATQAFKDMNLVIPTTTTDLANSEKTTTDKTNDLGTAAANAAASLTSLVQPISDLVKAIGGLSTVNSTGPVTVTGSPVNVTGTPGGSGGGGGGTNFDKGTGTANGTPVSVGVQQGTPAWWAGQHAATADFQAGAYGKTANPYPAGSQYNTDWQGGYDTGKSLLGPVQNNTPATSGSVGAGAGGGSSNYTPSGTPNQGSPAWRAGMNAAQQDYAAGAYTSKNPFAPTSQAYIDWQDGYNVQKGLMAPLPTSTGTSTGTGGGTTPPPNPNPNGTGTGGTGGSSSSSPSVQAAAAAGANAAWGAWNPYPAGTPEAAAWDAAHQKAFSGAGFSIPGNANTAPSAPPNPGAYGAPSGAVSGIPGGPGGAGGWGSTGWGSHPTWSGLGFAGSAASNPSGGRPASTGTTPGSTLSAGAASGTAAQIAALQAQIALLQYQNQLLTQIRDQGSEGLNRMAPPGANRGLVSVYRARNPV